jgi:NTP pyrophosphatase (non-canonical NTP hydrolase)
MDSTPRNVNSSTTLDGYQTRADTTAAYPGRGEDQIVYPAIALAEEAGELAGVVLMLIEKQQIIASKMPGYVVAEASLRLAAACGAIMGLVKKTYRNDPPGELTPERRERIRQAALVINDAALCLSSAVRTTDHVEFPSVVIPPAERDNMVKEAGDVLWYVACFCTEARISLGYVGDTNYAKLADRAQRDVIRSTGDDR